MRLEQYINKLFYRCDCVVVPDFGGFLCNPLGSGFDPIKYEFYPPSKVISFNENLSQNDGLLANFICAEENISYQEALIFIERCVKEWTLQLQSYGETIMPSLGKLILQSSGKLEFTPEFGVNAQVESFGLGPIGAKYYNTIKPQEKGNSFQPLKYAAVFGIPFLLGGFALVVNSISPSFSKAQFESSVLPIRELVFAKETVPLAPEIAIVETKKYDIIVAAFKDSSKAELELTQLHENNFETAEVISSEGQYNFVSVENYSSEEEAVDALGFWREQGFVDAWPRERK